jgi:hypothetical protein
MPLERTLYARRASTEGDWVIECSTGLVYHKLRRSTYLVTMRAGATRRVSMNSKGLIRDLERAIAQAQARIISLELEIMWAQNNV